MPAETPAARLRARLTRGPIDRADVLAAYGHRGMVEVRRLIREGRAVDSDGKFTLTEGIEMAKKQTRMSISVNGSLGDFWQRWCEGGGAAMAAETEAAIRDWMVRHPKGPVTRLTPAQRRRRGDAAKARFGSLDDVARKHVDSPDPRKVPSVPIRIEVRPDAPSPLAARRSPLAAKPVATAAATDRARRWNDQIPTAKRSPVANLAKPTGRKAAEVRDAKRAEPVDRPTKPPVPVVDMERGRIESRRVEAVRPAALDVRDPRTVRF